MTISTKKAILRWVLGHPEAVSPTELEEWAGEFENQELKELLELIIGSYREHGRLDYGLLVQQATGETQRQHICALTLEEDESGGPLGDFRADDWRRDLKVKHLKRTRTRLKARLRNASDDEKVALNVQCGEIDQKLTELSAL